MADILATTNPPDLQARAAALTAAMAAGDADLTLLADATTTLFNAQLDAQLNIPFSGGSDSGDSGDGGGSGGGGSDGGSSDGGGTGGEAGDGGGFSPLPGAVCDFALTMDDPTLTDSALADLLATGTVTRPDLQAIAPQVNTAFAGRQAALASAFSRLFPNGLGRPLATTANAQGTYFLPTPPDVPGFVRCRPPEAKNLVLTRYARGRQPNERLPGQDVTPPTTVISLVATQALQFKLDPLPIQDALLADVARLTILLPDHLNGNGQFATVQLRPGETLANPELALLALTATATFNTMLQQQANIPANTTFTAALTDYFRDAAFQPALDALTRPVNLAVDQGQAVIGLGRNDISRAASTGTVEGTSRRSQQRATRWRPGRRNAAGHGRAKRDHGYAWRLHPGGYAVRLDHGYRDARVAAGQQDPDCHRGADIRSDPHPGCHCSAEADAERGPTPARGPAAGGILTLTGTHFQAGATVTIGGTAATAVTVTSATQLTALTPAGPASSTAAVVAVVVTNPDGQQATLASAFTYAGPYHPPTLSAVTPVRGSTAGGTSVTLTGTHFQPGATVTIGGTAATAVTVTSATQLTALTPAGAAGPAAVVVTNPDGQQATLASAFTYNTPPVLSTVTP